MIFKLVLALFGFSKPPYVKPAVKAPKPAEWVPPPPVKAPAPAHPKMTITDLRKMKKGDLQALACRLHVHVEKTWTKNELIDKIYPHVKG